MSRYKLKGSINNIPKKTTLTDSIANQNRLANMFSMADGLTTAMANQNRLANMFSMADGLTTAMANQNRLADMFSMADGLTTAMANQNRLADMFSIADGLTTAMANQNRLANMFSMADGLTADIANQNRLAKIFAISDGLTADIASLKVQQNILNKLTSKGISLSDISLSDSDSEEVYCSATALLKDLESSDLEIDNIQPISDTLSSNKVNPLTVDKLMRLIEFIIQLILLIQAFLPNQQLTNIENQINKLEPIETQLTKLDNIEKQLDTLESIEKYLNQLVEIQLSNTILIEPQIVESHSQVEEQVDLESDLPCSK